MQNRDTLNFLKRVTLAQNDILRIDQLLTYLRGKSETEPPFPGRTQDAEKYRNVHTEEPLWFVILGTVMSAFLPALLVVWSYYYMRFDAVEYVQIPGIIGASAILAILCGGIRLVITALRKLEAGKLSLPRFISDAEYTKNLAKNAVCRALDIMEMPDSQRDPWILSAVYQYLIHHKDSSFEEALASCKRPYLSEPKSVRPAPAIIYFYLRRTRRNANKLIKISC